MKKFNSIALVCTVVVMLVVTSCSKGPVAKPRFTSNYDKSSVKSIMKLANPALYSKMYESKDQTGTITIIKGIHDMGGNCIDDEAICSVVVITTHPAISVQDSISLYDADPSLNLSFAAKGDAVLIQAKPDAPTSDTIRTVDVIVNANGDKVISYVPF